MKKMRFFLATIVGVLMVVLLGVAPVAADGTETKTVCHTVYGQGEVCQTIGDVPAGVGDVNFLLISAFGASAALFFFLLSRFSTRLYWLD